MQEIYMWIHMCNINLMHILIDKDKGIRVKTATLEFSFILICHEITDTILGSRYFIQYLIIYSE